MEFKGAKEQRRGSSRLVHGGAKGPRSMNARRAFTLVELLVVIAIIGILAAISFPVFAESKKSALKGSDMSNLNSIRVALQLYRADQGAYPPALLGYATGYSNFTPSDADIIPADKIAGALYPKRIDAIATFRSASQNLGLDANKRFTRAVWPNKTTMGETDPLRAQKYGPSDGFVNRCVAGATADNYYYQTSGYDVAEVETSSGKRTELRYTLFWSGYAVASNPCAPAANDGIGSASDDPRQLGYTDPPETTVVTWNSFYRQYDSNKNPQRAKFDFVLTLGGKAQAVDSRAISEQSWKFGAR